MRLSYRGDFSVPSDIAIPRHSVRSFRHDIALARNDGAKWIFALFRGLRRQREASSHHLLVKGLQCALLPSRVIFGLACGVEEIWSHLASIVWVQACLRLGFVHFRKAKNRGRVGPRSNERGPSRCCDGLGESALGVPVGASRCGENGLKTIYAGRAGNTTGISK